MLTKAIARLRDFSDFLLKEKPSFLTFFFVFLLLFFLPGQDFYWQARIFWRPPQVRAVEFSAPKLALYPVNKTQKDLPYLSAKAFFVFDPLSGVFLALKDENLELPQASITKIMTALVSLEAYKLNQVLVVPPFWVAGQKIELLEGEQMTVENLLIALLVGSANDAAETLARNYPAGREAFIERMNEKARELFLENTHFANPTGLDQIGHFSTAFDLARLSTYALTHPTLAQIVSYPKATVASVDDKVFHLIDNINELLVEVPGTRGVKTGWTDEAGECLVTLVEREEKKVIFVVLGSRDRFGETKKMINWVFENFIWVYPGQENYSSHFGSIAGT